MPGYADYQRTVNYDDPLILNDLGGAEVEKTITRGRFDVSRFAYIMGKVQFTKLPVCVRLEWFMAETGGEPIGERFFRLDNLTPVSAQIHIPNMGPWLQVKYEPESAAIKYKPVVRLMPSNRVLPFETVPAGPAVYEPTAFKLAAKATKEIRPELYYAGPCEVEIDTTFTSFNIRVESMLRGFEYERQSLIVAAGVQLRSTVLLPFTAHKVVVENLGAAEGECFLSIIPSITGSN